jgi:hypothetical protein
MLSDAMRQATLIRPSLVGFSANCILQHLKQLQNAWQPMLHFNSIQASWGMRHAFVPMEAMSGQGKNAFWLPENIMGTISGVKGVCLRIDTSAANTVDLGMAFLENGSKGCVTYYHMGYD